MKTSMRVWMGLGAVAFVAALCGCAAGDKMDEGCCDEGADKSACCSTEKGGACCDSEKAGAKAAE